MGRGFLALVACLLLGGLARAEDVHGVPLPRGARRLDENLFSSPRSFRDTVAFYRREAARRKWNADLRPTEKAKDVVFVRILSRDPTLPWSAVHILLADGKTSIYILHPENELGDRLTAGRRPLEPSI